MFSIQTLGRHQKRGTLRIQSSELRRGFPCVLLMHGHGEERSGPRQRLERRGCRLDKDVLRVV
eukprot:13999578-Alexandrium_andersonii.AAC.1